jgi:lambda family phage portal protein
MSQFVAGDDLVHMFKVLRPGQVRGVPWFAPILTTARDISDFLDAVNVKAKVEACFAAFITNDDPTVPLLDPSSEGINQTFDQANPQALVTTLEPGMMKELRTGQDIKFAQPTSATQIDPILIYNLQAMASGVGCTYDMATGDLRQASYISLRAGKLVFWALISQLQAHTVIPMLCRPAWDRFVSRAVLAGRLKARRDGYPCDWVVPAREAINPKDDLGAERDEVRAGRITPQQFIASKGGNWRTNLAARSEFFKLCDDLGLILDIDPRFTDQHGRQPTAKGDADPDAIADDIADDRARRNSQGA